MIAILTLIIVLVVSLLLTRVATVALVTTGLSREAARFQARSAFTGVGFTTGESEKVVGHPVRRRILMLVMLLGNAGFVTAVSSLVIGFVGNGDRSNDWTKLAILVVCVVALWQLASSPKVDRFLSRWIERALRRHTDIDVRDYAKLLQLAEGYTVRELKVQHEDWLCDRSLADLALRDEGVLVLGIERGDEWFGVPDGSSTVIADDVLLLYGRNENLDQLDERRAGFTGEREHERAAVEQEREARVEKVREKRSERKKREEEPESDA